jgi:protein TonB
LRILLFIAFFNFFSANAQQDSTIYSIVDKEAEFQGGVAAMMAWVQKNLVYPLEAVENNLVDSRIYITIIVETDGSLSQITVNTKCESCANSFITLMQTSPNWIPAQLNGRNVRSKYIIPMHIDFD